jgi:hypothetical protein
LCRWRDSCRLPDIVISTGRGKDEYGILVWFWPSGRARSKEEMKTWIKYTLSIIIGLAFSAIAIAGESVPIEDRNAFEKQYIDCIMSGAKDNCMVAIFSMLPVPRHKNNGEVAEMLNEYYMKKMATHPVYKVHLIEQMIKAGVFDSRSYLVERDNGSLMELHVIFRNIKGKWFVFKFVLDFSLKHTFKLLGMPIDVLESEDFSTNAMANEPITDKDAFEKQYIDCIISGATNNCFVSTFSNHRDPHSKDLDEALEWVNKYYKEKIAFPPVYKIHVIEKTIKAEVFDNRSYLIERDNGSLVGFYISFRRIKDKWYVFTFKFGDMDEFVYSLLGMPYENIESKK